MSSKKSALENLPEEYKKEIQRLGSEGVRRILEDRTEALEYAKKGILQTDPENLTPGYLELVADSMQVLARIILEERGILRKG